MGRVLKNFFLPFLLLAWLLVKLGESSRRLAAQLLIFVQFLYSKIQTFARPAFTIPTRLKLSLFTPAFAKKQLSFIKNLSFPFFHESRQKRGRPKKRPFLKKFLPSPFKITLLTLLALGILGVYFAFLMLSKDLPTPTKLSDVNGPLTTTIYDRNGELLYRIYEGKNRSLVKLNTLPSYLIQATIATEDKNFYAHSGVDLRGILRSVVSYLEEGKIQGGSTITQQLIKNTLLTPEQTLQRKIKEVVLAFWAERIFTKQEILSMYFNEVAYGGPAWGIAAASQTYFDKNPQNLTLAESAYLAGLPASPTTFSPYGSHPELGKQRQKEVLRRMVEEQYINQTQADEAFLEKLNIKPPVSAIAAPHFVMYVRDVLAQKYGLKTVSQGGLQVTTSLDLNIQRMAEKVVFEETEKLAKLNVTNGAAMVTDPRSGQILAMVGSKNYWDPQGGNFNVTLSQRQPGSSIKPATYATAFKQGMSPGTTLIDAPVAFKNDWEVYAPVNYDGRFHGVVTIRTALGSSYNIPAVKTLAIVGIPNMIQTAKDMGITTFTDPDRYGLSLTLGGGEVKLIDMMTLYGTLSQLGNKFDPQPILKVTSPQGNVLEDNTKPEGKQVLPPGVAYLVTNILSDNNARTPAFGPNSLLNIPNYTVAVKTGTTDSKRDNWTFGYTPNLVVGVWVGNNNNEPMDPTLTSGITGAAPIWNRLITNLLKDKPNMAFTKPTDVVEGMVDGHKDLVIQGQPNKTVVGFGKQKVKDDKTNEEKDVLTFTDPFSTLTQDQLAAPKTP